jgi:AAA domain
VHESQSIPQPRKAEKKRVKIKAGVQGPSGSGKTWGALALAFNLWPNAKVCVIDSENESASLYADHWEFDTIPLTPPFTSARYQQCIEMVVHLGYDVAIIDSLSHQWDGEGGILRRKEALDQRPGANSWANWAQFTPEHQAFIESIKQAPIHIIATMRAKQDYVLEQGDKGKTKPVKVGMAPIVREGTDYEFSIVFDVQMDHKAVVSKNRTGLFESEVLDLASQSVADRLRSWLESGAEVKGPSTETWKAPTPGRIDEPQKTRKENPSSRGAAARQTNPQPTARIWERKGDILTCEPFKTEPMERNGQKFVAVKLNERVNGSPMAFCFITQLFGALSHCADQRTVFRIDETEYTYITDVLEIAGKQYEGGVPRSSKPATAAPASPAPTTAEVETFWQDGETVHPPANPPANAETAKETKPEPDPLTITDDDLPGEFWTGERKTDAAL